MASGYRPAYMNLSTGRVSSFIVSLTIMLPLSPYKGNSRKLVIGIDIGTTFSGVAYCVLDPGEVPKVLSITRCVHFLDVHFPIMSHIAVAQIPGARRRK